MMSAAVPRASAARASPSAAMILARGRPLPATILFDYPTIEGLTGYLADDVLNLTTGAATPDPGRGRRTTTPAPREHNTVAAATDATGLSDDDVEAVLAEELAAVAALLNGDRP